MIAIQIDNREPLQLLTPDQVITLVRWLSDEELRELAAFVEPAGDDPLEFCKLTTKWFRERAERGQLLKTLKGRIRPLVSEEAFAEVSERLDATSTEVLRLAITTDLIGEAQRRVADACPACLATHAQADWPCYCECHLPRRVS